MADPANPDLMTMVFSAVLSGTVASSLINLGWNAWTRKADRKREEAKEANRIKHVYLDIARDLELFSSECAVQMSEIENAQHAYYTAEDRHALGKLQLTKLRFDTEPSWIDLPVEFVDTIKDLIVRFDAAGKWIANAFQDWADPADAGSFEQERLAFYGNLAARIARDTRKKIGAGRSVTDSYQEKFDHFLAGCKTRYLSNSCEIFIPDLQEQFNQSSSITEVA